MVIVHYFVHFINVSVVPGPDNKAQAYEANRESKLYPVRDSDGAARVLASGVILISSVEAGQMWQTNAQRADNPTVRLTLL